jgi:hypothetical protein
MGLTLSPRLWVTMFLISTLPLPWLAPSFQCGPPPTIFSTIIGHLGDQKIVETNKYQLSLHGTRLHLLASGHIGQGNSPTKDPALSGHQGRATPAPRKWLTRSQIQQQFPHMMGEINAMETISS